jgi:N-acetylmuramoyl-L-alanine amidase
MTRHRPLLAGLASLAVLAACAAAFVAAWSPAFAQVPSALALNPSLDYAETRVIDGVPCVSAGDLGRLLGATRFWRPELRKLELRLEAHRVVLTVDNPFVLVDDTTLALPAPVILRDGELRVPAALIEQMQGLPNWPRLLHDPRRAVVLVVPATGIVGAPQFRHGSDVARVTFSTERPEGMTVAGRARGRFRVRFDGVFSGALPDSLPASSLVRGVRAIPAVQGCAFEMLIAPEAVGYQVTRDVRRGQVTIEFRRQRVRGDEAFAPAGPAGARQIDLVVIDPGHGGVDVGAREDGVTEKSLTLDLARLLREELTARMPVRVLLTRDDDRTMSAEQRAEFANRVRADLVLSLHFDGFEGTRAAGATAYCAPATAGAGETGEAVPDASWTMRPWRDVPFTHAVQSRALAEALLSAMELRGQGPTRLRETLPYPLVGVDAPGVMLECATLTSDRDRTRVTRADGLRIIASTLADGIEAYRRNE